MNVDRECNRARSSSYVISILSIIVIATFSMSICAQSAPTDAEAMQKRLARARALTAAHNLTAAAFELDAIRTSTTDDVMRDVARIMLMGIYLEQADYGRAQRLLDETYKARTQHNEGSCRSYFAVAGQTMNGVRAHLDRFRSLGLNVTSKDLPAEAISDLDMVRNFLGRIAEQAKEIGAEDRKNTDAFALLEDVANVRLLLARDSEDRERWQIEIAEARQNLAASDTRLASLSGATLPPDATTIMASSRGNEPNVKASLNTDAPFSGKPAKPVEVKSEQSQVTSNDLPSKPATDELVNVGSLLEQAVQKVNPTYPTFAKTAHVVGIVRVDVVIDQNGSVVSAQSTLGPPILRQAAIDASKRWKFRPVTRNGQPVKATGFINFNFTAR